MRRIRYQVACSLDGYIAGPDDDYDWIVADPDIDFQALFDEFDTLLTGRRTYDVVEGNASPGMTTLVVSRTLDPDAYRGVTVVSERVRETLDRPRPLAGAWRSRNDRSTRRAGSCC